MIDWRIYERDVDVLLAEEFYANKEFGVWVLSRLAIETKGTPTVTEVSVSLSDEDGESDMAVIFEEENKSKFVLLIEDKIDAVFQHNQLERYRVRGQRGFANNRWQRFHVVLCAPRAFIEKSPLASNFDATLAYEEIADWLETHLPGRRGEYRANFLRTAAPRGSSAYVKRKDSATDEFWNAAYKLAHSEFPELAMKQVNLASGGTWVNFRPDDIPVGVSVYLKGFAGFADLTFTGVPFEQLNNTVVSAALSGVAVHQTGKSAAVRLTFPAFSVEEGVDVVETKVRRAFEQCRELIQIYRNHRTIFEPLIAPESRFIGRDGEVQILKREN